MSFLKTKKMMERLGSPAKILTDQRIGREAALVFKRPYSLIVES